MEHDIAFLTPTLVACVPTSSAPTSPDTTRHALDLPGRTAAHAWQTELFSSTAVGEGSSISRIQTDIRSQTCSIGFMSGFRAGHSMTSTSCWSKKVTVSCAAWGGALFWMYTKLRPNTSSPLATFDSTGSGCRFMAHPHRSDPPPPPMDVDCIPYHDWRATISVIRLDASINQPLPLPTAHQDPTVTVVWENRDSSLKIQYLYCLRSQTLCFLPHSRRRRLCSRVSLGHAAGRGDQYPAARSHFRMVRTDIHLPNRRTICIRWRGAEMKRFVLTIWSSWRFSRGVEIFIEPPRFLWRGHSVASQNFAYASLRHPQHSGYFSLRIIAICRQPDNSLQYLFWQMLWHDSKVQRTINSLYRNPRLHIITKVW